MFCIVARSCAQQEGVCWIVSLFIGVIRRKLLNRISQNLVTRLQTRAADEIIRPRWKSWYGSGFVNFLPAYTIVVLATIKAPRRGSGQGRGVQHGRLGSWPLKICTMGQTMPRPPPPKMSHFFTQNRCWTTPQAPQHERWKICQKWKAKPIFRGTWNSLMAWPD